MNYSSHPPTVNIFSRDKKLYVSATYISEEYQSCYSGFLVIHVRQRQQLVLDRTLPLGGRGEETEDCRSHLQCEVLGYRRVMIILTKKTRK